jgi:hypothetical protein
MNKKYGQFAPNGSSRAQGEGHLSSGSDHQSYRRFTDFEGVVDSIDQERGRVRVLVSFFGRETRVDLDFLQVTKGVE